MPMQPPNPTPVLALLALAACGGSRSNQEPAAEPLPAAADTLLAPWPGQLPVAALLGPSRWVVVAPDYDAAVIADLGAGTLTPLGGPRQRRYLHPFAVTTVGDTIYLADWGMRRTTVWSADGRLVDSIPAPDATRGTLPKARDAAGRLYFEVAPPPGRDGSGNRDSAVIVRASPSLTRFDTVMRLAPLDLARMERESTIRFERRVLSGGDLWGVRRDGTIWVARTIQNRVDFRDSSGNVRRGPGLPDPVYEITQADRDLLLATYPEDVRPRVEDLPWAIIHPPFTAAFQSPDGAIWLEKSKPAVDTVRKIHVLDEAGDIRRVLLLFGHGRLIAVGSTTLLVAEPGREGVRLLEVRIPPVPPTPPPRA